MKSILSICLTILVAGAVAHTVHLSHSQKEKVGVFTGECVKESGVKPEVLAEAKKGVFENDDALKEFIFCFFKKSGIISEEGKLNVEQALAKLPTGTDKASVEKLLEECKKITGSNHADTALEMYKCYFHGTKQHIFI